ncbi:MAG: hypothetical protein GF370_03085 [Candidatus Nealsonbacteria bacterium]|nr:hypothetical protein [Candidatus Nealsonbacteria bacterium]
MPPEKIIFGYYLTLDIYDCDPKTVGSLAISYRFLDNMPSVLNVYKLSQPFVVYTDEKKYPDKAGVSGWIPLLDNKNKTFGGVSIHTLTPTNFISIDVYCNRKFNTEKIKKFTQETFHPQKIESSFKKRGKGFK